MAKHYIAMYGFSGCLPESCEAYPTKKQAEESLVFMLDLPPNGRVAKELRQCGLAYLNAHKHDLTYCEVTECDCADPGCHCASGEYEED